MTDNLENQPLQHQKESGSAHLIVEKTATDDVKYRRSIKWQILSIAAICVLGFVVYFVVTARESNQNAALLKDIRDHRYPLQARLISAQHKLEFISFELESAVTTGDIDTLDSSELLAEQFNEELDGAIVVSPTNNDVLNNIKVLFDGYYSNANLLASKLIDASWDYATLVEAGQKNELQRQEVVNALNQIQQSTKDEFTGSISHASKRADRAVLIGYITGALTMFTVLLLAFYTARGILSRINAMVSSLRTIAQDNGDMSVRIPLTGRDEMTELAFWFNTFIHQLEEMTIKSTAEIKRIANTDYLSGLYNRRKMMELLHEETAYVAKENGSCAVFFLDLDNFKPINDKHGHESGDELIRQIAHRLEHEMEVCSIDLMKLNGQHALRTASVGRLGGDEFILLIPGVTNREQAAKIADSVLSTILVPFDIFGVQCNVGASIGISLHPMDTNGTLEVLDRADMAMYDAKNSGKNTYRFYDSDVASAFSFNSELNSALGGSIANNEFSLVYQPKFSLQDGAYAGAEALIRWDNPELGRIPPDVFIAQAEKSSLIYDIDEWVLKTVCQQIADWKNNQIEPGRIAINMSAMQIHRADLLSIVTRNLERYRVNPLGIEIEITETSALENDEALRSNIGMLRSQSINVAMDDFGAGHSSLQLLINCQIDTLKIDKTLIDRLQTDKRSQAVVQSIINLSKSLGIKSVAEGIENLEQYTMLRSFGCDFGQGYYMAKPVEEAVLLEYMRGDINLQSKLAS